MSRSREHNPWALADAMPGVTQAIFDGFDDPRDPSTMGDLDVASLWEEILWDLLDGLNYSHSSAYEAAVLDFLNGWVGKTVCRSLLLDRDKLVDGLEAVLRRQKRGWQHERAH